MKDFYSYLFSYGGGIGGIAGMYTFRHKTRKWYFKYGFPIITVLEIILAIYLKVKGIY